MSRSDGFTLIELISVIILLGILSAVAVPRFFTPNTFSGRGFADQTAAALRYGQKVAIAQQRNVFIAVTNGAGSTGRIALCFDAACTLPVLRPAPSSTANAACNSDRTWFCDSPPNGVTLSATVGAFSFNALGQPSVANQTVTVTGDNARTLVVEPETGYVH